MSKNNRQNRERKKRLKLAEQRRVASKPSAEAARPPIDITLPTAITDEVTAFCNEITATYTPLYVDVEPAPSATINECFVNVEAYADANGGSICYGWNIMEWPGILLEAMFHAVWRSPEGDLLDVTPHAEGERRILFVRDDTRTYDGSRTPSRQRALAGAPPEAQAFIEACQAMWAFEASQFIDVGVDGQFSTSYQGALYHERLQGAVREAQRRLVVATTRPAPQTTHTEFNPGDAAGGVARADIDRFARSISSGPLGLAHHRPQPWASPHTCYNNASEMASREGGCIRCGWTFHVRTRPGIGDYVFATPHAVWHSPHDLSLVDVTPHPDPHHAPVMQDGSVLFLVDESAAPVGVTDDVILSLPLRFFAVGNSPALVEYVAALNALAVADFERDKRKVLATTGG